MYACNQYYVIVKQNHKLAVFVNKSNQAKSLIGMSRAHLNTFITSLFLYFKEQNVYLDTFRNYLMQY